VTLGLGVLLVFPVSVLLICELVGIADRGAGVGSRLRDGRADTARSWIDPGVIDLGSELDCRCPLWRLSVRLVEDKLLCMIGAGPPN
jgi:hypothetical protein